MNTAPQCYSHFFGVAASREGLRTFKAWVDGSSPSALTTNPLGLLDMHSQRLFSQKTLTHTQPTACEPPNPNVVHLVRDNLSVLAEHELGAHVRHVSSGDLHIGLINGHHPSSHAGAQRMKPELLPARDSCGYGSRAQVIGDEYPGAHRN